MFTRLYGLPMQRQTAFSNIVGKCRLSLHRESITTRAVAYGAQAVILRITCSNLLLSARSDNPEFG